MFRYYDKCIFCFSELTPSPTGEGEHVIPRNIFGFWRVYDVCDNCRKYFGDNIDHLSIRNPWIIKALKELKLPELDKYSKNLPFVGTDTIFGNPIRMIKRGEIFKPKVITEDDNFMICSEKDWETIGIPWIKKYAINQIDTNTLDFEIEKLKNEHKKLKPGEMVKSKILGITIRKGQVENVQLDKSNLPSITPLIAKIAIFFLVFVLDTKTLYSLKDIESLVYHARNNNVIPENLINWCPLLENEKYSNTHILSINIFEKLILLDISLFGYPNWRIPLSRLETFEPILIDNIQTDRIAFRLSFDDFSDKKFEIGIKSKETGKYKIYKI